MDGGKRGNLHEAFYHGNDAAVGGVAVEAAGDFVALYGGLAVVRQAAVGGGEVRAVARAVVFVRQQVQQPVYFGVLLAVEDGFLQCHVVGQFVGDGLHGVAVDGVYRDVAAFGQRHHFAVGQVAVEDDAAV